ncbi:MAG: nitroreductase family protein, partial [Brevundimonas sp.]
RFVVLGPQTRADIAARLDPFADRQPDPKKARAVLAKLANPPVTILVISTPTPGHKVPVWEQELSAGAVCMNLSHAANALGFATNWITDWYAYDPEALAMFGVGAGEKIAGFIHIGTAAEAPLERPRPDMAAKVTTLP